MLRELRERERLSGEIEGRYHQQEWCERKTKRRRLQTRTWKSESKCRVDA
jgi:hypothetical protein